MDKQSYLKKVLVSEIERFKEVLRCDKNREYEWEYYDDNFDYYFEDGVHELVIMLNCISKSDVHDDGVYVSLILKVYYYDEWDFNNTRITCEGYNDSTYEDVEFVFPIGMNDFLRYMRFPNEI